MSLREIFATYAVVSDTCTCLMCAPSRNCPTTLFSRETFPMHTGSSSPLVARLSPVNASDTSPQIAINSSGRWRAPITCAGSSLLSLLPAGLIHPLRWRRFRFPAKEISKIVEGVNFYFRYVHTMGGITDPLKLQQT